MFWVDYVTVNIDGRRDIGMPQIVWNGFQVQVVFDQKSCKGIEHLPPKCQPIATTIYRWTDGIGEKEWNDEYCKKIIERNKEEEEQSKQGFLSVSPIKQWLEKHDEKEFFYAKVNDLFEKFKEIIDDQKSTKRNIKKELCCLVKEINKLQTEEHFFETSEREEIISYLSFLLSSRNCIGYIDEIDNIREW